MDADARHSRCCCVLTRNETFEAPENQRVVTIGCGSGFWGDDVDAPRRLVDEADLDYLVMDFLAELTMSILQKQKAADPRRGYAYDIVPILRDVLPIAARKGTKVVTNAGGVNPRECARRVAELARELGLEDVVSVGS